MLGLSGTAGDGAEHFEAAEAGTTGTDQQPVGGERAGGCGAGGADAGLARQQSLRAGPLRPGTGWSAGRSAPPGPASEPFPTPGCGRAAPARASAPPGTAARA